MFEKLFGCCQTKSGQKFFGGLETSCSSAIVIAAMMVVIVHELPLTFLVVAKNLFIGSGRRQDGHTLLLTLMHSSRGSAGIGNDTIHL